MTEAANERHLVAEIDCGRNPDAIAWVAQRPLHHFWPLLSPYFRDVLLTPQRRSEEDGVSWHWRERAGATAPRASELTGLRKRLAADQQAFAENLARDVTGSRSGSALHAHANVDELGSVMEATIARLNALPDAALMRFVCRTDAGLRLHSWSATAAASPRCPAEETLDVAERTPSAATLRNAEITSRSRSPAPIAAVIALLLTLCGGGWAWSVRSNSSRETQTPDDSTKSASESRVAAPTATKPHPNPISHAAAGAGAHEHRVITAGSGGSSGPDVASGSDSSLGQSDLARELMLPANTAGVASDSPGTPLAAAAMPATASPSATPSAASASNSSGGSASSAQSTSHEPGAGNSSPEPAPDPSAPKRPAAVAQLRRATAAAADAEGALAKKPTTAATAPAEGEPPATATRESDDSSESTPATLAATAAMISGSKTGRSDSAVAELDPRSEETTSRRVAARRAAARNSPTTSGDDSLAPDDAAGATTTWRQTIRLRISSWQARLLDDAILPTTPRLVGTAEDIGALRGEMLRAKTTELPASFRSPTWRTGLAFARPGPSRASTWTDIELPRTSPATLHTREGAPVAELIRETDGELTLRLASDISARFWLMIEPSSDDEPMPDGSARFQWRSGEVVRAAPRCEIGLTSPAESPSIRFATVRDRLTGWALTAEIRLQRETTAP